MPTQQSNRESGFVSLFTVIFFIMLIAVITVGFLRVMGVEQQQSLNNDLTASAVAAADSGVEDGKRAILSYYTTSDPALKAALGAAFTSNACDSLTGSAAIRTALKLDAGGNVIGNAALNQYYTCLTVSLNSPDYLNSSAAGASDYIPLVPVGGSFDRVKIAWHLIGPAGVNSDGVPTAYPPGPLLPPVNGATGWSGLGYPSYLRIQLYAYPSAGAFDRAALEARSHSMLLVPATQANVAAVDATTPIDIGTSDPRGYEQAKSALQQVKCINSPATNVGSYACTALVQIPGGFPSASNNYYLRVTPIYGQSHFQVGLLNGVAPVDLSGVQPIIDSTGRAADVYRRQQARVRINALSNLPEYVVQSANDVCKNMIVSDGSFYQPNCP